MPAGYVISDLHLFTPWTAAAGVMHQIRDAADSADFFVLNGDVFDFRWSSLPTTQDTLDAAVHWLRTFAGGHPRCRLYFVMGNHDAFRAFGGALDRLAGDVDNFEWRPACLRLGPALFTHGDLFLRDRPDPFTRPLGRAVRRRSATLRRCYRLLHAMRVHRWHAPIFSSRRCARLFLRALQAAPNGHPRGLTDIYFGHTHTTFTNFRYRGYTFHNTGSIINGLPWHLLPVEIP